MGSQKGFVTTEFLFAIVIAFGMSALTFALTFTLSTVEVAQYIVYSSARAQAAGNLNSQAQVDEAINKYKLLLSTAPLGSLFTNGWFTLSKAPEVRPGNGQNFEKEYPPSQGGRNTYQGVRTEFVAKILEMRLPFLGKVTDDDGFKTRVLALMIREPSHAECVQFMRDRVDEFKHGINNDFGQRFGRFLNSVSTPPIPWEDNGC